MGRVTVAHPRPRTGKSQDKDGNEAFLTSSSFSQFQWFLTFGHECTTSIIFGVAANTCANTCSLARPIFYLRVVTLKGNYITDANGKAT